MNRGELSQLGGDTAADVKLFSARFDMLLSSGVPCGGGVAYRFSGLGKHMMDGQPAMARCFLQPLVGTLEQSTGSRCSRLSLRLLEAADSHCSANFTRIILYLTAKHIGELRNLLHHSSHFRPAPVSYGRKLESLSCAELSDFTSTAMVARNQELLQVQH